MLCLHWKPILGTYLVLTPFFWCIYSMARSSSILPNTMRILYRYMRSIGNTMKIINIRYFYIGNMKDWLMNTMHLRGTNSLCLPYRYLDDVDFYASHVKQYNFKLVKRVVWELVLYTTQCFHRDMRTGKPILCTYLVANPFSICTVEGVAPKLSSTPKQIPGTCRIPFTRPDENF